MPPPHVSRAGQPAVLAQLQELRNWLYDGELELIVTNSWRYWRNVPGEPNTARWRRLSQVVDQGVGNDASLHEEHTCYG